MHKGRIVAINISSEKGVPKTQVTSALLIKNHGLNGDAHAGPWHRQVSLLGVESAQKVIDQGMTDITHGRFAENITTEGLVLYVLPVGTQLMIGDTLHEITQIGKECHNACTIKEIVGDCVMPREGIFTRVLKGGVIKINDPIKVILPNKEVLHG